LVVDSTYLSAYQSEIKSLLSTNLEGLREPLGLGWYESTAPQTKYEWFLKIMGWLITALAVSLGAPFWFDLLKKIMSIRNSGYIPNKVKSAVAATPSNTERMPSYQMSTRVLAPPISKSNVMNKLDQENNFEGQGIKSYG